ncbi:MAG: hypothetical protein MUC36_07330 [Planctomycetes bacterium]|jgi:ABC-type Fe3+-siderophore transport system permease subunit|nr:hypothetical protein [Planctomycetota bacterium]
MSAASWQGQGWRHVAAEQGRARLDAAVPIDLATRQAIAELGDLRTLAEAFHQESQMHPMNKLLGFTFALGVIYLAARLTGTRAEILVTPIAITPLVTIAGMVLGGLTASFGLQQLRRLVAVTAGHCSRLPTAH